MPAGMGCERRLAAAREVGGSWRKLTPGRLEVCKWAAACVGEGDGTCGILRAGASWVGKYLQVG